MGERRIDIARLFRPRSIAIVGIAPEPGSPGFALLGNLDRFSYAGSIHLVSRNRAEVAGRPCVPSIDALPDGVDLAMLMLPRAAIEEAVAACVRRKIGAAVVFAAGFGESGGEWAEAQERFAAAARAGGLALCGPNCLGLMNYIDGVPLTFSQQATTTQPAPPTIAIAAQSGGLATILRNAFWARGLGVTYTVSTGNEAVLTLEDYLEFIIEDRETRVVATFAEEIRRPQRFLALAARARELGKPIVLLHPGRSAAARASAQSHTGALAGDHAMIVTLAAHAGAVMVESLEELIDVSELMVRFAAPPTEGLAILTDSGAIKGVALDHCEALGLDLPPPLPATAERLRRELPEFVGPTNPLDVTAQGILHLDLYARTIAPLLADPSFGSLLLAVIVTGGGDFALNKGRAALRPVIGSQKPVIFGLLGDEAEIPQQLIDEARGAGVPFFRSPERGLRALARITAHGRAAAAARRRPQPPQMTPPALPGRGVLPEHASKSYLAALGIPVPRGQLARDLAAAQEAASAIGFPVALKLQSPALPHKSDIGGVALGVSARGLASAWRKLEAIARRRKIALDGILVEAMAKPGLEAIVGARRDPRWGAALLVGLGGIWTEALNDVRLLPPDLDESEIAAEIAKLKGAKLFAGLRGAPPRDTPALAGIVARIGALMRARPEIREIDLNPVMVLGPGEGALALDALIVTA
jgi:acetate---CoA ligase (ADP-forming)